MQQLSEWSFALTFFCAILGFLVSGILFFANRNQSLAPRLLAAYFCLFSLTTLHSGLSMTRFFLSFPHLWRSIAWATFSAPVFGYLYVRSVLHQSFKLKKTDVLLFLPALLYTLLLLTFYIKPTSEKIIVISQFMSNRMLITLEPEGFLPQGWGFGMRVIFGLTVIAVQYKMLFRTKKKIILTGNTQKQNQTIIQWLFLFTTALLLFYILVLFVYVFLLFFSINIAGIVSVLLTLTILFISLSLFARPSILYGLRGWIQHDYLLKVNAELPQKTNTASEGEEYSLTTDQGKAFKSALETHFNANIPYIKPGYAIGDLSKELNIPAYLLSPFINQEYGKNFKELVN